MNAEGQVNPMSKTEQEVRALRNIVYGHNQADAGWNQCRENWMKPDAVKWLQEQANMLAKPRQKP